MPHLLRRAPKDRKHTANRSPAQPGPRVPVGIQPVLASDLDEFCPHEGVQEVMDSDLEDIDSPRLSPTEFESRDEGEDDVAGAAVQYFMAMRSLQADPTPLSKAHKARKALVAAPPDDKSQDSRAVPMHEEEMCSMAHVIRQDLGADPAQWGCRLSVGPFCL